MSFELAPAMSLTLEELSQRLMLPMRGNPKAIVDSACSLESPKSSALSFCEKVAQVKLQAHQVGILISPAPPGEDWNCLLSPNPRITFAQALSLLYPEPPLQPGIHETAWVDSTARVHPGARVGPLCCIQAGAVIEEQVNLIAQVFIGTDVVIGKGTRIGPGSSVAAGCKVGDNCVLEPGVRIRKSSVLGNNVWLGSRAVIDAATLAAGIKADNQIYVGPGSEIGPNVLLISQSCVGPCTRMGAYSLLAAQGAVLGHLEIAPQVQIAGRCVVSQSILEKGLAVAGDPAVAYSIEMRNRALRLKAVAVLAKLSDDSSRSEDCD